MTAAASRPMNILLLNPFATALNPAVCVDPVLPRHSGQLNKGGVYFPLGLCSIAAYLRRQGHAVTIIDPQPENRTLAEIHHAARQADCLILPWGAAASAATTEFLAAFPDRLRILFGNLAKYQAGHLLRHRLAEAIVTGEPELTVGNIIANYPDLDSVRGVLWWDGRLRENEPQPLIADLDTLPFPARDLLNPGHYYDIIFAGRPTATLITSRGCPWHCSFCAKHLSTGQSVRYRSAGNVAEEIEAIIRDTGIRSLVLWDDNFNNREEHALAICAEITRRQLRIEWSVSMRVDRVSAQLLAAMKAAGCVEIRYGIETYNDALLARIRKEQTVADIDRGLALTRAAGIPYSLFVIFGIPGETRATIANTVQFLRRARPFFISCSFVTPMPGSALYEEFRDRLAPGDLQSFDLSHTSVSLCDIPLAELRDIVAGIFRTHYFSAAFWRQVMAWLWRRPANVWSLSRRLVDGLFAGRSGIFAQHSTIMSYLSGWQDEPAGAPTTALTVLFFNPPGKAFLRGELRCEQALEDATVMTRFPPVMLGYCAALVREQGGNPLIRDYSAAGLDRQTYLDDLLRLRPRLTVLNGTALNLSADISFLRLARLHLPETATVLILPASRHGEFAGFAANLAAAVDFIIYSEPEAVFPGLYAAVRDGAERATIKGVYHNDGQGAFIKNPPAPPLDDLDRLPLPARDLMENRLYVLPDTGKVFTTIIDGRGCAGGCHYCLSPVTTGPRFRTRSVASVIAEISDCQQRYGISHFIFRGDSFTAPRPGPGGERWVHDLCAEIIARRLRLTWSANSRVDHFTDELAGLMRAAGCTLVAFGVESADDASLQRQGKGTTSAQALAALAAARRHGIRSYATYIVGFPWEDAAALRRLEEHIFRLNADYIDVSILTPFPGTRLHRELGALGLLDEERMRNGYNTAFNSALTGTQHLTRDELVAFRRRVLQRYHFRAAYILARLRELRSPAMFANYARHALKLWRSWRAAPPDTSPLQLPRSLRAGVAAVRARLSPSYRCPLGLYIVLTDQCNARCAYCNYDRVAGQRARQVLTAPLICAGLDQFARLGTVKLNLSGGEPLLFDGLGGIIRHARKLGMFVAVSSNGLAMPERIGEIADANVVMLSFDGSDTAHNGQRGAGTHDRVIHAMELLRARGLRFFITTVLTNRNLGDVPYILSVARRYRTVANFTLLHTLARDNRAIALPAAGQVSDFIPDDAAARAVLRQLIALKQAGEPVGSTYPYLRLLRAWPDYRELYSPRRTALRCMAGRLYCHWYPDGMLYACGQGVGIVPGTDMLELGAKEAFRRLPVMPGCHSCFGACDAENNLIYNLHPQALLNWHREIFRLLWN